MMATRKSASGAYVKAAPSPSLRVREPARTYAAFAPVGALPPRRPQRIERITSAGALRRSYEAAPRESVWMLWDPANLKTLTTLAPRPSRDQRVVCVTPASPQSRHVFDAYFSHVLSLTADVVSLEPEVLAEVVTSNERASLFIAASYDAVTEAIVLYRGDLETIVVPVAWFMNPASGALANPAALAIIDYGHTVQLGAFEAATDAILYEFDAAYRKQSKSAQLAKDASIGGAIRRLRLQRGYRQTDLPGVDAKTLARIERGEVKSPHRETIEAIARALGVTAHDLPSY